MPEWLEQTFATLQLVANLGAVAVGAVLWKTYIGNLRAALTAKTAEISTVEKTRDFWKDKALDLEKRSPEFIEDVLSKRIANREAEIGRLMSDQEQHEQAIASLQATKGGLEESLAETRGFRAILALEAEEYGFEYEELTEEPVLEVVKMGEVGVDSGQLMITDPCYIDSEWVAEPFEDIRIFKDSETGRTYKFGVDFDRFDRELSDLGETVTNLLHSRRLIQVEHKEKGPQNYSYNGACKAISSEGFGELKYRLGHTGAGIAFATAFGDGSYPIYGEKRDGRIVRVYLNVG